jgi:hypothetical protein
MRCRAIFFRLKDVYVTSTDPVEAGREGDKGQTHESSSRALPADRAQYSYVRRTGSTCTFT